MMIYILIQNGKAISSGSKYYDIPKQQQKLTIMASKMAL
jgi:hypothetical protein